MTVALETKRFNQKAQAELSALMTENQLSIHYQPIVHTMMETVQGYEALTRFPKRREINNPAVLFQLADETNRLFQLEKHTRELAIDWISPHLQQDQQLWVNLTPSVIHDSSFTPGFTHSVLKETGLSPHQIVFEITEHSAISDFKSFRKLLEHYRTQGFKVAIDDVGTGYSSLQTISELKPDYLKVDRSLISDIHRFREKQYMLEALQQISMKMDAGIVAEGVETEEECLQLIHMGIELMQGYYFAKPGYPPPPLPKKWSDKLRIRRHRSRFPLRIDETTTFTDLGTWIRDYKGPYDHQLVIIETIHTRTVIPLKEVIRFTGAYLTLTTQPVYSDLLAWWK